MMMWSTKHWRRGWFTPLESEAKIYDDKLYDVKE